MEIFSLGFYAVAVPAVFMAGVSKGGFGSGAAFASSMLLALVVEPTVALAIMLPLLMVMDVTALPAFWRKWDGAAARVLILGSISGVIFGGVLFGRADPEVIRVLIGAIALGFVAFQVAQGRGWLRLARMPSGAGAGIFWGGVAGFTSFVSHAGGPPAAVYLLSRNISKQAFQATTVLVFWAINAMKIVPYAYLGAFSRETLLADLSLVPVAILGILAGIRLHARIPAVWFFRVTYVLLTVTGSKLVWDGLT